MHWFRKWRRLPVSLNLPLCHPRDGLLFPLRRIRVSLRSRPRRARALCDGTALLPMLLSSPFVVPFVVIIIVAQGTTSCASPRTSWQAGFHFIASSFAICHSIVLTIYRRSFSSHSRVSQCLQWLTPINAAVGHRKQWPRADGATLCGTKRATFDANAFRTLPRVNARKTTTAVAQECTRPGRSLRRRRAAHGTERGTKAHTHSAREHGTKGRTHSPHKRRKANQGRRKAVQEWCPALGGKCGRCA